MYLEEINRSIEDLNKQWRSLQPLKPEDYQRLWKKIRLEWNYNSNRIEGNTLTYKQTEQLLDQKPVKDGDSRDIKEMKAHNVAIEKVKEFAEDNKYYLTEADVRNLNLIILKEPFWKEAETAEGELTWKQVFPGKYKTQPNHVRTATGEIFKFAIPEEVPAEMKELMDWFKKNIESPPASMASFLAELHHRFIIIHPFDDGNGRIARLLLNYVLMRFGYPPFVIKNRDKRTYFSALRKADAGDMNVLSVYLGETLISWLEIGIKAAKEEDISELEDIDKEVDIFIREKKAEGLSELKPLSEQIKRELCKQLLIPLFETFKNQFTGFKDLFNSNTVLLHAPLEILNHFTDDGETDFGKRAANEVYMRISYKTYKGEKPFDIAASISVTLHEFEYRIIMQTVVDGSPDSKLAIREKTYARKWTDFEIKEFVVEGEKLFFERLKQRAGGTAG